ncbi:MAG TPA: FeoA family protein [Polyangiaceae bacterium]|nr:FeoA family protein [Polyangiaceae bacterium]
MQLGEVAIGVTVTVTGVGGERAFRRRVMELGVLPGTRVTVVRVAPLGDPIELSVRGCELSIRKGEARCIEVEPPLVSGRETATAARMELPRGLPAAP